MKQVWRPIPGFESKYEISDTGIVRSYTSHFGRPLKRPVVLKQHIVNGSRKVLLGQNNWCMVNKLVLAAFGFPQTLDKPYVLHYDLNRLNCNLSNLSWGTRAQIGQEISLRHLRNGVLCQNRLTQMRRDDDREKRHRRNWNIVQYVRDGNPQAEAARKFGVSESCVSRLIRGSRPVYPPQLIDE